jgi:hypothetical protein
MINSNTYKKPNILQNIVAGFNFFFFFAFIRSRVLNVVSRVTQHSPTSTHFHPILVVAILVDRHCSIPNSVFEFVCGLLKILWIYTYARKTVVLGDSFNTKKTAFALVFTKKITSSPSHLLIYNECVLIRRDQALCRPQQTLSCIVILKLMAVKSGCPGFAYRQKYFTCNESNFELFISIILISCSSFNVLSHS